MAERNRAWRRRKARNVIEQVRDTKEAILRAFAHQDKHSKPYAAQKLRSRRKLDQELRDATSPA